MRGTINLIIILPQAEACGYKIYRSYGAAIFKSDFPVYYQGREYSEFQKLLKYASGLIHIAQQRSVKGYSEEVLLKFNDQGFQLFGEYIVLRNSGNSLYFDTPVFASISIDEFFRSYLNLSNKNKRMLAHLFEKRYSFSDINEKLLIELKWLKSLKLRLKKEAIKMKGKISGNLISDVLIPSLIKIITKLNQLEKSLK